MIILTPRSQNLDKLANLLVNKVHREPMILFMGDNELLSTVVLHD